MTWVNNIFDLQKCTSANKGLRQVSENKKGALINQNALFLRDCFWREARHRNDECQNLKKKKQTAAHSLFTPLA